ncbi:MAG: hypothetical protein Q8O21_00570 [bacterium]|nr:hypothetical protein [bacterium]
MTNEKIFFQPRYNFKKENIFSLSKLPDSLSERKKSLGWPVEIQGTGRVIEGTNDFEIRYPEGDIFLSFAATIHELGHLRQEEFNPEINKIDKNRDWGKYSEIKENDAYQRGFKRVKQYFPEVLLEVENKFQQYKKRGKLKNFFNFEELYEFLYGTININKAIHFVPEMDDKEKQDELEYQSLKENGIEIFFKDIKESRVDEKINKEWVEDFIMKMAEKISNE